MCQGKLYIYFFSQIELSRTGFFPVDLVLLSGISASVDSEKIVEERCFSLFFFGMGDHCSLQTKIKALFSGFFGAHHSQTKNLKSTFDQI